MSDVIHSVVDNGMQGIGVDIECRITNGLPSMMIVGSASKSVDEAKERVRNAFTSSGLNFPKKRITINLAPGDTPKDGTGLDVAISVAILTASEQVRLEPAQSSKAVFLGEIGLDGSIRPIRGIIGKLIAARDLGQATCYVPAANVAQAALVPGIQVVPVASLRDLYLDLTNVSKIPRHTSGNDVSVSSPASYDIDMADVVGQPRAKRALEIAAAGGHNVLFSGPPGTGKSMLAKAFRTILPTMTKEEILEVTHLHSLATSQYEATITQRPFRSPHHSASHTAISGGGQKPRPGEISLAHNGVLFLDEIPEFSRQTIEALRQPLEDHTITVSRARQSIDYPASFILIATANPCPCGYYGTQKVCECLPSQIAQYQRKLSGPLLDRIDMHVDVSEVLHKNLLRTDITGEPSKHIQQRVTKARQTQQARFSSRVKTNGLMTNQDIKKRAAITPEAADLLNIAAEELGLSARNYMRTIKVARTIADLANQPRIDTTHMAEALQYRQRTQAFQTIGA